MAQKKLARIPSVVGGRPMPTSGSLHRQQSSSASTASNASIEKNTFPELVSPKPQKPLSTVSGNFSRALENQDNDKYTPPRTQSWYVGDDNELSHVPPSQYQNQQLQQASQYQNQQLQQASQYQDQQLQQASQYQDQQLQQAAFYSQSTNGQQYGDIRQNLLQSIDEDNIQDPNFLGRGSLDIDTNDQYPEPLRAHHSAPASPIMTKPISTFNNEQYNRDDPNIHIEPNIYNEQSNQPSQQWSPDYTFRQTPPKLTVITDPNVLSVNGQYTNQVYVPDGTQAWNQQPDGQYSQVPVQRPLSQGSIPRQSYYLRAPSPSGFNPGGPPDRVSFYGNPDRYSTLKAPNIGALRLKIDDTHAKRMTMTSFTLASDEKARERYRDAARKSNNPVLQVEYAKFLIGMSNFYMTSNTEEDGGPPLNTSANDTYKKLVEEAVYWIDKLSSKNQPEASYIKGTWHEFGKFGKEQSTEKALKLYNSSAKLDHPQANFKVGEYHEHQRNAGRALSFYKKAASLGDVSALYRLAMIYILGDLRQEVDYKQALIFLKQAATKANEDCADGAYLYGMILAKEYTKARVPDELVVPDEHEAKELIQKAANLGHVTALYKMGHCHEYATLGCPYDPVLSVSYYKRAADKGNVEAQMALSKWYLCGAEGYFDQNEVLAYEHAEKAAKSGLPAAEFAMGYFHEVGINVPIDVTVSTAWYSKAAAHGNEDAKQRIARGGTITRREHELQQKKLKKQRKEKKEKDCIIM